MRKLEIRQLTSPDVQPYAWMPESREDVYFLVELRIGAVGDEASSDFQVIVATPEGLRKQAGTEVISDRGCIVLSDFVTWSALRRHLQAIVDNCAVSDPAESVDRLQRYFYWEYEDFGRPAP